MLSISVWGWRCLPPWPESFRWASRQQHR